MGALLDGVGAGVRDLVLLPEAEVEADDAVPELFEWEKDERLLAEDDEEELLELSSSLPPSMSFEELELLENRRGWRPLKKKAGW